MTALRLLALCAAAIGAAMLLASGLGTRAGVWDFRVGLSLLRYAAYVGLAAFALSLTALLVARGSSHRASRAGLFVALLLAGVTFAVPYTLQQRARNVPPIHDISTDTADPPRFVDVLLLRADASNSTEYEGDSLAALQRAAYPRIQPIDVPLSAGEAFGRSLKAATDMGWTIVVADSAAGRIEATVTTTWFGFKDDVVVRIRTREAGARIDVRSVSRVGRSDVGANAARIARYTARLAN